MSFLKTDYSGLKENNYGALPTGEYEMIINKSQEKATPNGAESLQIDLIVRNDVKNVSTLSETNGKFANRHVFMENWKRKATNQYDLEGFMYILQAVGVPEGTAVNSIQDFINLIDRKPVKVYVKKEVDDYNTTDSNNPVYRNAVAPWNFSATEFKQVNHDFGNKGNNSTSSSNKSTPAIDISDEDMPF